jgi:hypothetical protein
MSLRTNDVLLEVLQSEELISAFSHAINVPYRFAWILGVNHQFNVIDLMTLDKIIQIIGQKS